MSAHPAEFNEARAREVCAQRFQHFDGYRSTAKQDDLKTVFVSGAAWGFTCGRTVSAEQVEAAAKGVYERASWYRSVHTTESIHPWEHLGEVLHEMYREQVRAAFTAAGFRIEGDPS